MITAILIVITLFLTYMGYTMSSGPDTGVNRELRAAFITLVAICLILLWGANQ